MAIFDGYVFAFLEHLIKELSASSISTQTVEKLFWLQEISNEIDIRNKLLLKYMRNKLWHNL